MKAACYTGDTQMEVQHHEPVPPGAGEVQIRVAYTGICGTDLHVLQGHMDHRVTFPAVLGHEMSGRIAAMGEGVRAWSIGDAVTVMPLDWCGHCPACVAGYTHICHNLNFIGIDSPGAMQARWNVSERTLIRLPSALDLRHGALVEPTAVAVHDVGRANVQPGEKVVVIGSGPVGVLIGLVAQSVGADVVILDFDPFRRGIAEQAGLRTLDAAADDVAASIDVWTAGAGADVAFEVSGSAGGITMAVQVLAVRGRLTLVGIHSAKREIDLYRVFWRELVLVGARLYDREDFESAVELVATGSIPADLLISRIESLDHTAEAFAALESGAGVMKILIDCQAPDHTDRADHEGATR
jgi:2-desacetyl-2-hydroxyethyl bacteriochlorophyllide A dehydrogenase